MNLREIAEQAEKSGSYMAAVTIRDKELSEGNLKHFFVREDFPTDDIVSSLDASVRSIGIKPEKTPEMTESPRPVVERRLKVAIISHFSHAPDSYSPGRATKRIIQMLKDYGHEPVFFVTNGSDIDAGCEMRPVVPRFKRQKNIVDQKAKDETIRVLRDELSGFDLAISIDLFIEDCITYRQAIMECGVPIGWIHWARSGIGRPIDFSMPNALYVYMNRADSGIFAERIGVAHDRVRLVFNDADPSIMFGWGDITREISDKMRLWDKDIIQTYPLCTTRFGAKGLSSVIDTFAALKGAGKSVALIVCNSNGRRRIGEVSKELEIASDMGLYDGEDILFTSTLPEPLGTQSEVPHSTVTELMRLSNLFVFPTKAEVCPNVLLEAAMNKNLVVINSDLPLLKDFTGEHRVLSYPFTSSRSLHYSGRTAEAYEKLAKSIIGELDSNKPDKLFRKVWRNHCLSTIYRNQLSPTLQEAADITKSARNL
jgi:hypothetical protein